MKNTAPDISFEEAEKHLVGGVNSPVRAFKAVGGEPFFVARAEGARLFDTSGRAYLDYVMSWGAQIFGHARPEIVSAVRECATRGTSYGAATWGEVKLAKLVKQAFPSIEKIRFVSSGTEAVMSAIRLARGVTGRKKIVKFIGGYHGHSDGLLVKAGSGGATFGIPDSQGVPEEIARLTIAIPYNDEKAVEEIFASHGGEIACVLVEPVAANMGLVLPGRSFLRKLRERCCRYKSLLIFDEVITGFRLAYGGAQEVYKIVPDLTCLGKILGGGLPLAALGGREDVMSHLAPEGAVYQAGTLSGNPLATACGIEALGLLKRVGSYEKLTQRTNSLVRPLREFLKKKKLPVVINSAASLFTVFFTPGPVIDLETAKRSDVKKYAKFFHELLGRGIFFPPSQFEACFLSLAHTKEDIDLTAQAVRKSLTAVFK